MPGSPSTSPAPSSQASASRDRRGRNRARQQDHRHHRRDPRKGRTLEVKQKLIKQICASWSEITGQPVKQVVAGLNEIDSDITMEYGLILPHPGGEAEWFATNADALDG